jgi:hypothetical protein
MGRDHSGCRLAQVVPLSNNPNVEDKGVIHAFLNARNLLGASRPHRKHHPQSPRLYIPDDQDGASRSSLQVERLLFQV